ncbi:MAG TPA: tetratricopeptide repeat protein [Gemmataceae bacterium]|nr:tetratricopeptide repeat protein [Gemmataceae bacterium]
MNDVVPSDLPAAPPETGRHAETVCAAGAPRQDQPAEADDQRGAVDLRRGKAHAARGDYDLAVADFTLAIRLDPNDSEAFLLRGQVCEEQGEHEQAIADYSSALQIDVNRTLALAQRVLALTTRGEFDSAVAGADESLRLNRRLSQTYFLRGSAYFRQGEWVRACADFAQVVQLDPANGLAFLRRGEAHAHQGDWARAVADFTEALRVDPNNVAAYNLRGEALQRQGHHDRAVADFTEALRLDPQYTPARNNRGDAYFRRGHYDEAIADYSLAIHLEPDCARSYLGRSIARGEKGDYERALADFAKAISLDPANPFAGDNPEAAHRLRAAYDRAMADLDRFRRDFRKAAADLAGAIQPDVRPALEPFRERLRADETLPSSFHPEPAASRGEVDDVPDPPRPNEAADVQPRAPKIRMESGGNMRKVSNGAGPGAPAPVPEAGRKPKPSKPAAPPGKLRLECPECGTAGLLDVRNLARIFRCPGCRTWWRTSLAGDLIKAPAPGIEVEVTSDTGRSKHRVPVVAESQGPQAAKAESTPDPPPKPAKAAKSSKSVKPEPREGRLRFAGQWVAAAAKTRAGRWAMAGSVVVLLVLVPFVFPSLFPSQLRSRGQKASQAWLARDVEQIKQYVEPTQVEYVERWLKEDPPPNLDGQQPRVDVAVERNDGRSAEVVIQIRAKKDNGAPAYFVFRQRWISKGGVWYVQPNLRPHASVINAGDVTPRWSRERCSL